ncbi:hypothetical protein GCM10011574_05510 [Microbispora bryophytorum]|uniref:Uncharacterized protein n=1 Tax=Microbispora bryophytorum TaxID=1460882 RepID=A0A8H9L8E3_9ACTN|nr:hypothetical protein GCM10011574_05510 [Microbispora bryophytorum]
MLVSDLRDMSFTLSYEHGRHPRWLCFVGDQRFSSTDTCVWVRHAGALRPITEVEEERFASQEYFAALWSLAGMASHTVNRPGRWAWDYGQGLRSLIRDSFVGIYTGSRTTEFHELVNLTREKSAGEIHWQDPISLDTWCGDTLPTEREMPPFLRAQVCDTASYDLYLIVGEHLFPLRSASGLDRSSERYATWLARFRNRAAREGLSFYTVAVVGRRGHPLVSAVRTDPPLAWYRQWSDEVHDALVDVCCGSGKDS